MSGTPVWAGGHLVGVVTEHAPRAGPSAITVIPLTGLSHDSSHPGWGLGVPNPAATPPIAPAPITTYLTGAAWLGIARASSRDQRPEPRQRTGLVPFARPKTRPK